MKNRRAAAVFAAILMVSLLAAGCGRVATTGTIQGYVVQNGKAKSLAGPAAEEKITVLAEMPKGASYIPLAGAWVQAEGLNYPYQVKLQQSDSNGRFRITGLKPGQYRLTITHERFLDTFTGVWSVSAGKTTPIGGAPLGSLHILSIGINEYANPQHNLRYARPDAELIAQVLGVENRLAKQTVTLFDYEATKNGILNTMRSMGAQMISGDTFIMFFSGHGVQYYPYEYIVPHDFDGSVASLIADYELNSAIDSYIPASHKVFIFDSCHSGGMYRSLMSSLSSGFQRSTGFEIMARNIVGPGKIVITACDKDQKSWESSEWGHGLFTRYFTWGMTPPYYTDTNGDRDIDTDEAFSYAQGWVTDITKDWDEPQTPMIYRGPDDNSLWYLFSY
jgi:hypothetical protein